MIKFIRYRYIYNWDGMPNYRVSNGDFHFKFFIIAFILIKGQLNIEFENMGFGGYLGGDLVG